MQNRVWLPVAILLTMSTSFVIAAGSDDAPSSKMAKSPIVQEIRRATSMYRNAEVAIGAGYIDTGNCVSGRNGGAMGVHFLNPSLLFDDGSIDVANPEVLIYEPQANGKLRLVGVEFLSLDDGDASTGSPILEGHALNFSGSPNRYGLPAHHELHVWAWKRNPNGTFSDWNPNVSCDAYAGPTIQQAS